LKCQKTEQGVDPIAVYSDLSAFKLYMADVGLLVMKSGLSHQTILSGGDNSFMGSVTENYVAQQLAAKSDNLYYGICQGSCRVKLKNLVKTRTNILPNC